MLNYVVCDDLVLPLEVIPDTAIFFEIFQYCANITEHCGDFSLSVSSNLLDLSCHILVS